MDARSSLCTAMLLPPCMTSAMTFVKTKCRGHFLISHETGGKDNLYFIQFHTSVLNHELSTLYE